MKNYQYFVFGLSLVNKKYNLPRLRRRKSSRTIAERNKVRKLQSTIYQVQSFTSIY